MHRLVHLRDNRLGHGAHFPGQLAWKRRGPCRQLVKGLGRGLRQVHIVQKARARLGREAGSMAIRAGSLLEEACNAGKSLFVLHLGKGVLHRVDRAVVREVKLGGVALVLGHVEDMALLHGPVQHDFLLVIGEVAIGHVDAHAHFLGDLRHKRPHELAPGSDRALLERERVIRDERGLVDFAHDARAAAGGAGARAVEGEVLGTGTVELHMADGTLDGLLGGDVEAGRHVVAVRALVAAQA